MASTSFRSSPERPPGLAVWGGLDPFGAEVVARLSRWLGDDPARRDLKAANRLLPRLILHQPAPSPGADLHASRGITPPRTTAHVTDQPPVAFDPATAAIQAAIGELLAASPSREALAWADRDLLVPHIWLVADLASPEVADLAPWLAGLHQRLDALQVEARVYLVLRNRSWGRSVAEQEEIARRVQRLVTGVCAAGQPGEGRTLAFVLSDRDGIGGRYTDDDTAALAQRFTDLVLLGDVPHGNHAGAADVFGPDVDTGVDDWTLLPVFGSVAGEALRWDAPALFRDNAEGRRQRLFAALDEPVPPSYDPPYPVLQRVDLTSGARWPALDLPRWSPRFWGNDRQEFLRAEEEMDRWLTQAARWRHEMLVVHEDRRAHVEHRADGAIRQYVEDLDSLTRNVLDDGSVPGFFGPLRRLHERAAADLRVRQADLRQFGTGARPDGALSETGPELDAVATLTDPAATMAGADRRLIAKLERKINPLLFASVTVLTFLIAWGWTQYLVGFVYAWTPDPAAAIAADPADTSLLGQARTWLTERLNQIMPTLQGVVPQQEQFALWSALIIGLPILAIAVITALRQRVVLERAWKTWHDQARRWRETSAATLTDDLARVELALARRNVATATAGIAGRAERLAALRALGDEPTSSKEPPDPAVSGSIVPASAPPPPLTGAQVAQIVGEFRRGRHDDPALRDTPDRLVEALFVVAARVAGDPEPDLRLEMPALRRRILAAMPPPGAIRVQQLETANLTERVPPRVARFFAAPSRVAADLAMQSQVPVLSLPVSDRFYAIVVQSGMGARRVLSLPVPSRQPVAPDPAPGPTPDPAPDPVEAPAADPVADLAANPVLDPATDPAFDPVLDAAFDSLFDLRPAPPATLDADEANPLADQEPAPVDALDLAPGLTQDAPNAVLEADHVVAGADGAAENGHAEPAAWAGDRTGSPAGSEPATADGHDHRIGTGDEVLPPPASRPAPDGLLGRASTLIRQAATPEQRPLPGPPGPPPRDEQPLEAGDD